MRTVAPSDMRQRSPANGRPGCSSDPFRPPLHRDGEEWHPGPPPTEDAVIRGILGDEGLRRALILKLLISHREEMEEVGQAFTDRVRGYLDGTLRPWSLSPSGTEPASDVPPSGSAAPGA